MSQTSALTYMPHSIWQCMLTFTLKNMSFYSYGTWSVSSYLLLASLSLCVFTTFEPERMTRKTIRPSVASGANTFEPCRSPPIDESKQANVFLPAPTNCQTHEHSISGQPSLGWRYTQVIDCVHTFMPRLASLKKGYQRV